ncbi:hypothetical protein Tco_0688725 [Tanacetum coccineum]
MDAGVSSAPKRSTVIRFRIPQRIFTRLTPPSPMLTVDKADEMILQDTLQVSLAEHKSREEQEARENYRSLGYEDHKNSRTGLEPRSDKESPELEITNDKEVEITNVVIPVNVIEEEEEITDEVYELKQREKGKIVKESRSTPFPTPIRSPSSLNTKLSTTNQLLSLFKAKPARFKRYKSFFQELQGRYGYLFEHLRAKSLSRSHLNTFADHTPGK